MHYVSLIESNHILALPIQNGVLVEHMSAYVFSVLSLYFINQRLNHTFKGVKEKENVCR